ncbi:putative protease SohB [Vibrio stylophorae]|uniref:Protease SohB n=1 Tax=Vibrio stylophorae TaxID=659351 RepID=A0ABM8ZS89_9VIBR|nr:protease SohB [Vibrio stylophorae]CAH0532991.1 putative protease SohB [Vibrio stylophorae]
MEFLFEYGLFFAKVLTALVAIVVLLVAVKSINHKSAAKGDLELTDLTENYRDTVHLLEQQLLNKDVLKAREKAEKKAEKAKLKEAKAAAKLAKKEAKEAQQNDAHQAPETLEQAVEEQAPASRESQLFVLDFNGSIDAKEVTSLREEVSAILAIANADDEVLVRLESGGGMVHGYGLAASQLARIKAAGIPLTVVVDKVAASGGYMMACVADKVLAAPFAIVGSIGVVAQLPNFHKLLKKNDIEFEQLTAGEFKRTLTMFGENTDKAREKFQQELEETHVLFKQFIELHRPSLDVASVATGEHWFGQQALSLGLIDAITTSDDYIINACKADKAVLAIRYVQRKKLSQRFAGATGEAADNLLLKWIGRGQRPIM